MSYDTFGVILVVASFLTRSAAFVFLILLYRYFAQAEGPMVKPFKHMFWTFAFLLGWVWIGSVAELIGYMSQAHSVVERGTSWIFIPNLIISVSLGRLLWKLHEGK